MAVRETFLLAARGTCSVAANEHFYVAAVTSRKLEDIDCATHWQPRC